MMHEYDHLKHELKSCLIKNHHFLTCDSILNYFKWLPWGSIFIMEFLIFIINMCCKTLRKIKFSKIFPWIFWDYYGLVGVDPDLWKVLYLLFKKLKRKKRIMTILNFFFFFFTVSLCKPRVVTHLSYITR